MDNIILIGFMGSGKTSVGKELAKVFSYQFFDSDELIEKKAGRTVKEIFAKSGEAYFRKLETELIISFTDKISNTVLSVGGGLPIQPGNTELLRDLGTVIYLKTSRSTIKNRLQGDSSRPLLLGPEGESRLEQLYSLREPIYKSASHLIITTDDKSIDEIVQNILEHRRELWKY